MEHQQVATLDGRREISDNATKPTVGIFSPYDLVPGGGEKYFLTIAEHLSQSATVYLVVEEIYSRLRLKSLARELGLDLDRIAILRYSDIGTVAPFDIFIAVGNEITPPVPAWGKESFYLCQFPFPRIDRVLVERRPNWRHYESVLVYSEFVRANVQRIAQANTLPEKPVIVLPPACFSEASVAMDEAMKRSLLAAQGGKVRILSVGRFFPGEHCKRHDVLIEALRDVRKLVKGGVEVELHLAGTLPPTNDSRDYYLSLLKLSEGLPVQFHLNVEIHKLEELYRSATFYWHAAGIHADPIQSPETMEHFGISVVEGMVNGCVPLVVAKGGPAEIVQNGVSGLHYATRHELAHKTAELLMDESRLIALRQGAFERAKAFSKEAFIEHLDAIITPARVRASTHA